MTVTTTTILTPDTATAVGMIGQTYTYAREQYTVHSVEGPTWYVFAYEGTVIVDNNMTGSAWVKIPAVTLLPTGSKIGDGHSITVPANSPWLRRGVCLAKSYA